MQVERAWQSLGSEIVQKRAFSFGVISLYVALISLIVTVVLGIPSLWRTWLVKEGVEGIPLLLQVGWTTPTPFPKVRKRAILHTGEPGFSHCARGAAHFAPR